MKKEGNGGGLDISYLEFAAAETGSLLKEFNTSHDGLSDKEVKNRLEKYGYNEPSKKEKNSLAVTIILKFFNPLIAMLLTIIFFSLFFGEKISALFVALMVLISVFLDVIQEYKSEKAVEKLNALVKTHVTVIRDGKQKEIDIREIVPGDIVDLFAGNMIAADMRIISCKDLFVNQSSLTGESFPAEKKDSQVVKTEASLSELDNMAFMGSSVLSGTALGLVVKTGNSTQFGQIAKSLSQNKTMTSFEKGISQFTMLMIKFITVLVIGIFLVILLFKHGSFKDALLFSLAVAVGLTPEMLPMMVTINLSNGAATMAKKQVIVKKLESIQNFGAMDVLCTDKTGTLTMDEIVLEHHCDIFGKEDEDVLKFAYINSTHQTSLKNVLDFAILRHEKISMSQFKKLDEIPFDFSRKIMSVVAQMGKKPVLISKGAPEEVFKRCRYYFIDGKIKKLTNEVIKKAMVEYDNLSAKGFRVVAIAYKEIDKPKKKYTKDDESDLVLKGYTAFLDPAKPTTKKTIESLHAKGIEIKILTGDNEIVTKKICNDVALNIKGILTGAQVEKMNDTQLSDAVEKNTIFARLSPLEKERVIKALQKNKHTVGYMGDGINDAPSLKAADVGISVNNAVDVAKESADIILLEKSLTVLEDGVIEGRRTFGNIVKYIKMGASSNFGNMLSMAGATIFIPFLPMLPVQVLFNNFLYDLSNVSLPTDTVDEEYLSKPRPWNISFIKKFMIYIGPISSIFDFMTFAIMWFVFAGYTQTDSAQAIFHTGWFIESLCTQTLIIYIIRTNKIPFVQSRPSKYLVFTTLIILATAITITFTALGNYFKFTPLPLKYFIILFGMIIAYGFLVQAIKSWLVKKYDFC